MVKAKKLKVGQHICFRPKDFDNIVDGKIMNGKVVRVYRENNCNLVDIYAIENKCQMTLKCDDVYSTFAEAKEAVFPERQKRFYEETETVEGLLKFLCEHARIRFDCLVDGYFLNDNDAQIVFSQRMREMLERVGPES